METKTKTLSKSRNATTTSKKEVKDKLTAQAKSTPVSGETVKTEAKEQKTEPAKAAVNLDDRIQKFEKLWGLANHRELLVGKLNELTKFNYNHDGSPVYFKGFQWAGV